MTTDLENFVVCAAEHFKTQLGGSIVEVYKLGSLAHGGFSSIYSDIDVGVVLSCAEPPREMADLIAQARSLDPVHGKKLSVFWGNPEFAWGRLPVIDRIDLLDHGVPLVRGSNQASADQPRKRFTRNNYKVSSEAGNPDCLR